jgi:pimeloyl-ACP methyl ester carboxylesterase
VTIQSYRHRFGYAAGDPALEEIEALLAAQPKIAVPTIALQGAADGVQPPEATTTHSAFFTGSFSRRVLAGVGHNPPQEAPRAFTDAVLELIQPAKA